MWLTVNFMSPCFLSYFCHWGMTLLLSSTEFLPRENLRYISVLVNWCFEPSQPRRITSGLNTSVRKKKKKPSSTRRKANHNRVMPSSHHPAYKLLFKTICPLDGWRAWPIRFHWEGKRLCTKHTPTSNKNSQEIEKWSHTCLSGSLYST